MAASHTRAVLSSTGGDDASAVGAERGVIHAVLVLHRRCDGLSGGRVPHPRRLVLTGGEDASAVGAERGVIHVILVLHRRRDGLPGGRVPDPRRLVATGR